MERSEIIKKLNENKFNFVKYTTHLNKYGAKRAYAALEIFDKEGKRVSISELDGRVVGPMVRKGVLEHDVGYMKEEWFSMVSDTGYAGYRVSGTKLVG